MSQVFNKIKEIVSEPSFAINMAMHALILFSFLSIFFTMYITKLSKDAFDKELGEMIKEGLEEPIYKLKEMPVVKQLISIVPLEKLEKLYAKPAKAVTMHNNGLINSVFMTNLLLWVMLIVIIIIMKNTCNMKINITEIAIENAITFTFVGIVEFMFFSYIAFKFVPVAPSFISGQFLDKVKNLF
jgi:hypothetical protein